MTQSNLAEAGAEMTQSKPAEAGAEMTRSKLAEAGAEMTQSKLAEAGVEMTQSKPAEAGAGTLQKAYKLKWQRCFYFGALTDRTTLGRVGCLRRRGFCVRVIT